MYQALKIRFDKVIFGKRHAKFYRDQDITELNPSRAKMA